MRPCDLVIEAAPEQHTLKQQTFAALSKVVAPTALLATNTSSLSVTQIALGASHPERVVGMHFFNPVHVMKLLEVIRAEQTSDATLAAARALGETLGKTIVEVRDAPGFASTRLGILLGLEAIRMLEQGVAKAEDIDRAMEVGYGHPMGPLKLTDHVGLDVRLAIARSLFEALHSEAFRPPALLERMVKEGKLGKKAGIGFYTY
jgi:3-hydroxybutyryl-CoA dehydrogenase